MTQLSSSLLPTDDTGNLTSGTSTDRAFFSTWRDGINTLVHSTTNPTISPANIIDEVVEARNGELTLNAYLDTLVALITASGDVVDIPANFGENVTAGDSIYLSAGLGGKTAGKWYKTDSSNAYSSSAVLKHGFAPSAVLAGASGFARIGGGIDGLAGLTAGAYYFASNTPGGVTAIMPTNALLVGVADSTTSLVVPARLPEASASIGGFLTTLAQTIAGDKTFSGNTVLSGTLGVTGQATLTLPPKFFPGATSAAAIIPNALISASGVTYTETGAALETAYSFTLKGNTLNADNKGLRIKFWGLGANNANAKAIHFVLGSTSITIFNSTIQAVPLLGEVIVLRTGAATQRVVGVRSPDGGSTTNLVVHSEAFAENLANDLTVAIKLQGGGASDIILYGYTAETLG